MAFNLNEFRNKLVNGGARPSQFEMQISWPEAVRGASSVSGAERDFRFFCKISEIPASTMQDIQVPYFGRKLKYAGDRTFSNLTVTIINDEDFKVRQALETWSAAISGHSTSASLFSGGINSGSYATDGVVIQHGRNNGGRALKAYKFVGMFPVNVGSIALDWGTTDQIEEYTCEFAYQWWEPTSPTTGAIEITVG